MRAIVAVLVGLLASACADPTLDPTPARRDDTLAAAASAAPIATSALDGAVIREMRLAPGAAGREGVFKATIEAQGLAPSTTVDVRIATAAAPIALRRRLAFHRLAAAIGARIVPACAARDLSIGSIGAWLAKDRVGFDVAKQSASVRNDGTIAALLLAAGTPASGSPWSLLDGRAISPSSAEVALWARAAEDDDAAKSASIEGEYVTWIALDYLAATTARRTLYVTRSPPSIALFDNEYAFPVSTSAEAVASNLRKLKRARRFPRALRDGLVTLDLTRERALFTGGGFEDWLLSPRAVIELDERRLALLSLIEARIVARGADAVLR